MFVFTREKLVWMIIAALGLIGFSLGIASLAKPVMMGETNIFKMVEEINKEENNTLKEVKIHTWLIVTGGFFAMLASVGAIAISTICIFKDIHPRYTKLTYVVTALVIISFGLGITALVMNADLNDLDWFDKLTEDHGAEKGAFSDWWGRKDEI